MRTGRPAVTIAVVFAGLLVCLTVLDIQGKLGQSRPGAKSRATVALAKARKLDANHRIALFVAHLDEIEGIHLGQPGPIVYFEDPLYQAIVAEGTPAVPSLIDDLGHDKRTTSTLTYFHDGSQRMTTHPVTDIIRAMLAEIWPSSIRWYGDDAASSALALRKAWTAESSLTEPERWVTVLADDGATPQMWLSACQYLSSATNYGIANVWSGPRPDPKLPMRGEPLRASRGPEITALMAKRALQLARQRGGDIMPSFHALRIGHRLAKWSPKASIKTLAEVAHDAIASPGAKLNYVLIAQPYALVMADRMRAGDRSAISEFGENADYSRTQSFRSVGEFAPLWALPNDPKVQAIARKLLKPEQDLLTSPGNVQAIYAQYEFVTQTMNSPLLTVSAYRKLLVAGIKNGAPIGEAWLEHARGGDIIHYSYGSESNIAGLQGADAGQPVGKHVTISPGDLLAQKLGQMTGAPLYCMIWESSRRSAAKKKLANWLLDDHRDWLSVAKAAPLYSDGER